MKYKIAVQTDTGIKKETNQDSYCVKEAATDNGTILMAVVCDGMGGLAKGELASATLIKAFSDWFENDLPEILNEYDLLGEVEYQWNKIVRKQNQSIASYGRRLGIRLGTTVTVMLVLPNCQYIIAHVGDCRAYKITNDNVIKLTEDQTVVAREIKQGRLTPEQAQEDPRRNILLQCVGASKMVIPAFYYGSVLENECYLLCSDGFRHVITEAEIFEAFAPQKNENEAQMNECVAKLIELNKFRHENDNITALLIKSVRED